MAEDRLSPIIATAVDKIMSVMGASGYFASFDSVEPKSAPAAAGMHGATWIENLAPIPQRSGLPVTSCRVEMMCRIYRGMLTEPQSTIDTELAAAASYLLAQFTGDFGIAGAWIDLLGAHGDPLAAQAGYVDLDETIFRIMDITVPFIADDVFDQGE